MNSNRTDATLQGRGPLPVVLIPFLDSTQIARLGPALGARADSGLLVTEDPARAKAALAGDKAARIVLFLAGPAQVIARGLEAGQSSADACAHWVRGARSLVALLRRHRPRLSVFPLEALETAPAAVLREAGLTGGAPVRSGALPVIDRASPLAIVLAQAALRDNDTAARLAAELEAAGGGQAPKPDLDSLCRDHLGPLRGAAEYRAEQDRVLENLFAVQEALVTARMEATRSRGELEKARKTLTEERDMAKAGAKALALRLAAAEAERAAVNKDLSTAIESLAARNDALARASTQVQHLRQALDSSEQQLRARDSTLAAQEADLHGLRAVQARQADEIRRAAESLAISQREIVRLDERLAAETAARRSEAGRLTAQITARDSEIARIYASHSMRLTAPLRWLRTALSRGPAA